MKRHTLEERIKTDLDMDVYQFAKATGVSVATLRRWHKDSRMLLKFVISGYRTEVKGG